MPEGLHEWIEFFFPAKFDDEVGGLAGGFLDSGEVADFGAVLLGKYFELERQPCVEVGGSDHRPRALRRKPPGSEDEVGKNERDDHVSISHFGHNEPGTSGCVFSSR